MVVLKILKIWKNHCEKLGRNKQPKRINETKVIKLKI